jgi:CDGSH-type Zn-finger protein/uncharacterized Fe-S cluster protein YjdI
MAATIECKPDGPYLVKDLADLRDAAGDLIATKPVMALCRCGGSKSKPFCDGTHRTNGFSGGFSGARVGGLPDRRDTYRGRGITIHDNRSICAHAGHCTDGLAAVFKYGAEPWIDPDGAAAAVAMETIHRCPSGALSYEGAKPQTGGPAVMVTKDGPYAVKSIELLDARWADGASPARYTLCRCGASKNKPFCDGTHWSIGFKG